MKLRRKTIIILAGCLLLQIFYTSTGPFSINLTTAQPTGQYIISSSGDVQIEQNFEPLALYWEWGADTACHTIELFQNGSSINSSPSCGGLTNSTYNYDIPLIKNFDLGAYNFTMTLDAWDNDDYLEDSLFVTIGPDVTAPEILTFQNTTIEQYSGDNFEWEFTEYSGGTSQLYKNGTAAGGNSWSAASQNTHWLANNALSDEVGTFNMTLVVNDEFGNVVTETVWLTVVPETDVPSIKLFLAKQVFVSDVVGITISDASGFTYEVYINGSLMDSSNVVQTSTTAAVTIPRANATDYHPGQVINATVVAVDSNGNEANIKFYIEVEDGYTPDIRTACSRRLSWDNNCEEINIAAFFQANDSLFDIFEVDDDWIYQFDLFENDVLVLTQANLMGTKIVWYDLANHSLGTFIVRGVVTDTAGHTNSKEFTMVVTDTQVDFDAPIITVDAIPEVIVTDLVASFWINFTISDLQFGYFTLVIFPVGGGDALFSVSASFTPGQSFQIYIVNIPLGEYEVVIDADDQEFLVGSFNSIIVIEQPYLSIMSPADGFSFEGITGESISLNFIISSNIIGDWELTQDGNVIFEGAFVGSTEINMVLELTVSGSYNYVFSLTNGQGLDTSISIQVAVSDPIPTTDPPISTPDVSNSETKSDTTKTTESSVSTADTTSSIDSGTETSQTAPSPLYLTTMSLLLPLIVWRWRSNQHKK